MGVPTLPENNERAKLFWLDERTLGVRWSDGSLTHHPLSGLRARCPCALCRQAPPNPLNIHRKTAAAPKALEVRPVGRYGLQIVWDDGHRTGIYTYENLKEMGSTAP